MASSEYMEDLEVNKYSLDIAWERQANLLYKWSMRSSEIELEIADEERLLDQIKATLELKIRERFEDYTQAKYSEGAVKCIIASDEKYKKQLKVVSDLIVQKKKVDNVVKALDHKKRALTKLSDLYVANYFADPYVQKEAITKTTERRTEVTNKVRSRLKRKR